MSKVWTKVVSRWDEEAHRYVTVESESSWYEYRGEVALCKGDPVLQQTELMQQQNMATQMSFNSQLMDVFNKQYADQKSVLDYLQAKVKPMIDTPTGYSDQALAAMRTSATDQLSSQYQNAQKALQAQQFTNGSRDLPSGVNSQLDAALMASEASDKAGAQNNITLANENLKQTNLWNAINELNGVGATLAPQSYAGAATNAADSAVSAGNSVAQLGTAYNSSKKGFWSSLASSFGSTLGSTLGGGNANGGGGAAGFFGLGCWIAAAAFNENFFTGTKTNLVRNYLWGKWSRNWYAPPVLRLYSRYGQWIATKPRLVKMLKPLFNLALRKAQEQK